jgi:hypothetical protein
VHSGKHDDICCHFALVCVEGTREAKGEGCLSYCLPNPAVKLVTSGSEIAFPCHLLVDGRVIVEEIQIVVLNVLGHGEGGVIDIDRVRTKLQIGHEPKILHHPIRITIPDCCYHSASDSAADTSVQRGV